MPNFETYVRGSSNRNNRAATVTVQARGLISLSSGAWERLGSPEAVVLLSDHSEKLVGFRAAARSEPLAYPVRNPGHSISGVTLLRYMGVSIGEARRYPLIVEDGLPPYIDLKQQGAPVTSNRAKNRGTS